MSKHENSRTKTKPVTQDDLAKLISSVVENLGVPKKLRDWAHELFGRLQANAEVELGIFSVVHQSWGIEVRENGRPGPWLLVTSGNESPIPTRPPDGYIPSGHGYKGMLEIRSGKKKKTAKAVPDLAHITNTDQFKRFCEQNIRDVLSGRISLKESRALATVASKWLKKLQQQLESR